MKYLIIVLSYVALVAQAFDFSEEWELWKKEHGKQYLSDVEEHNRHEIWEANKKLIDLHNKNADQYGFTMEMNMFGDLRASEHARMYHGFIPTTKENLTSEHLFDASSQLEDIPASLDWRERGYVTEVKTQGQCGSCWAFTATGALEGQHFKSTGKLVSLSEQNLMDCSGPEGNMGCSGGFMIASYKYIIKNDGIDTEDSYPYLAHQQRKCGFKKADIGATCSSYKRVKNGSESDLLVAVAMVGPIAVAVDATHRGFMFYKQGVYYEPKCSSETVEHSLLVVGYGSQNGQDYWIAKNSWGTEWGDKGYILMSRNKNNNCGIATLASYPVV